MSECSIRQLAPVTTDSRDPAVSLGQFAARATGSMEGIINESRSMIASRAATGDPS
jgi:hypothetical protein